MARINVRREAVHLVGPLAQRAREEEGTCFPASASPQPLPPQLRSLPTLPLLPLLRLPLPPLPPGTQLLARVHSNPSFTSASAIDEDNGAVALDARDVAANILKALALDLLDHHLPTLRSRDAAFYPVQARRRPLQVCRDPSRPQLPESPPRQPHQPHRRRALQPRQRQALRPPRQVLRAQGIPRGRRGYPDPKAETQAVPKLHESNCSEEIIAMARGPNNVTKRFSGFIINGFRFHTKDREKFRKTQNSGVMVEAEGQTYYGALTDIFELDYFGKFKVVLFRCDWVDVRSPRGLKQDTNGSILVNFSKLIHTGQFLKDDPFIFSSQAKQVFYVQDPRNEDWNHVIMTKPRDLYDIRVEMQEEDDETYTQCLLPDVMGVDELNDCTSWTKFKLPMDNNVNAWILKSVSRKWKDYKCELKAKYMIEDYTEQQIVNVVPKEIVPQQWVDLVHYWFSEKSQLYSRIGRASRAKHTTPHTTGSMSFARKRHKFEKENQREPGRIEFFAITHKSKDGSYINTTASNFVNDAMVKVNANIASGSSTSIAELENDAFIGIKGKDRYGRVRGYGIGVVPTQVLGPQAYIGAVRYDDNTEEVQRLKSKIQVMEDTYESRLVGMQEEYESKLAKIHQNYESRMSGMQSQLSELTSIMLNFVRPSDILGAESRGRPST
uniref:DUF4216 domain-containing protein n=1 Tax=Ananas comosus var. bracteatus TaxID=296719 RepID=A0A6V7Q9B3_ANACO|nr:unnamed protein product [Ananas comosus var. bracteatus]